jgi:uncharacterized cupin superfamily protein
VDRAERQGEIDHGETVVKLGRPGPDPITEDLEGWRVVDGKSTMKTWIQNTSADGSMISGTWEATPASYRATYTGYEFVHLIEGRITITPDGGAPVRVAPETPSSWSPGSRACGRSGRRSSSTSTSSSNSASPAMPPPPAPPHKGEGV